MAAKVSKVITVNIYPPIPDRQFDWCAYHEGEEETNWYGYGHTEQEAIEDLKRLDSEREECDQDIRYQTEMELNDAP